MGWKPTDLENTLKKTKKKAQRIFRRSEYEIKKKGLLVATTILLYKQTIQHCIVCIYIYNYYKVTVLLIRKAKKVLSWQVFIYFKKKKIIANGQLSPNLGTRGLLEYSQVEESRVPFGALLKE